MIIQLEYGTLFQDNALKYSLDILNGSKVLHFLQIMLK